MKIRASIALLSLPSVLAAVVQEYHDASPITTPSPSGLALRIPEPTATAEHLINLQPRDPRRLPLDDSSSSAAVSIGPSATAIGVFTAGGVPYRVTSVTGVEKVDGKTLVPGAAPINIGGVDVIERGGGALVAGGTTVKFKPELSSSELPGPRNPESNVASASSSAAASSSSSGSGNFAAMPTAPPGHMVALGVGAVVGAVVL